MSAERTKQSNDRETNSNVLTQNQWKEEPMFRRPLLTLALLSATSLAVVAQNETPLLRDETASIKKKLVAALDAVGQPPEGYSKEKEDFNLPTEASKIQNSNLFSTTYGSAERTYGSKKQTQKSAKDTQKEYQKKFAEAQAKGDVQTLTKLAQEMQQKTGEMQLKAIETQKEPVRISVRFNTSLTETIDPDAVVFEKAGLIALKTLDEGTDEKGRITVYVDPVTLKDTKQLSKVEMKLPPKGTSAKIAIFNAVVELRGPISTIEPWAKKLDTGKILAQIDGQY
jgi:hypothetical protein